MSCFGNGIGTQRETSKEPGKPCWISPWSRLVWVRRESGKGILAARNRDLYFSRSEGIDEHYLSSFCW